MADDANSSSPTPDTPPPRTTGGNWRWEPPTAAELQALMPGYTIEKLLGRGGMGAVYRGVQTNLDRPVAIKILPPGVEKEDPSFAARFKSEAKLMAKLNHPTVVAVYDFGTNAAGQLYFAMEYVDGSDVSQMISAQGKLPPEHALAITAHVCDALAAAHELGIVHRDIKPANVLLNMKGQVKVADFGLAKVEEPGQHGLTKTGYAMGTPDFVAPEALMLGTAIDGRADLYAVGVMLYQMLTGNVPRGAFKPASVLIPGLDPRYDPIIQKAMQHDREERQQSAMELRRELDVILTVPLVQHNAPVSAAIPVAQIAQAPGQRSAAQKPVGKAPQKRPEGSADTPVRSSHPGGAAAKKPAAGKSARAPLFIGIVAVAAIGIGAFVMFGGKKDAKPAQPNVQVTATTTTSKSSPVKPAKPPQTTPSKPPPSTPTSTTPKTAPSVPIADLPDPDGKPADLSKPVKVFILLGSSEMMGYGKILGIDKAGTLENAVRKQRLYPFLADDSGKWTERRDVRSVSVMRMGKGEGMDVLSNDWLRIQGTEVGPEISIGHQMGNALDEPVLLLKSCNGNRSLGWDLLPPGSKGFEFSENGTNWIYAGYKESPNRWVKGTPAKKLDWYAGKQYDYDIGYAKAVLADLGKYYPGAKKHEIAGFFFWQGGRDLGDAGHVSRYEQNLVQMIEQLRRDFNAPNAPFVCATLGEARRGDSGRDGQVLAAQLAVDGGSGKYPQFKGNVATVYSHPLSHGGTAGSHYDGNAQTFMDVGLGMGDAMVRLLSSASPAASGAALPIPASADKFPPGQWVKVFTKLEDLPASVRGQDAKLKIDGGWLIPSSEMKIIIDTIKSANCGIRAVFRGAAKPVLTLSEAGGGALKFHGPSNNNEFFVTNAISYPHSQIGRKLVPTTPADTAEVPMEFYSWEGKCIARSGEVVLVHAMAQGRLNGMPGIFGKAPVRDIEVINLDGLSEAEALRILGVDEKGNDLRALAAKQEQQMADQTKAVDAMAAIPELKTLHEQFVKLTAERVTAPFEAEVAKLNAGYVGGIDREIANEKKAGHLDGVIALEAEKQLIQGVVGSVPQGYRGTESPAPCPIPAEDDEKTTEALKKLRSIYRAAYAKIDATRAENLKALTDPLSVRLKQLVAALTQQDRVPDAKAVREYREAMEGRGAAPSAAAVVPQTAPAGASTPPVGDKSAGVPPSTARQPKITKPKDPFSEREAAEWVLSFAGKGSASVTVLVPGKGEQQIQSLEQLPKDKFVLRKLTVAPTLEVDRDRITDQEVLRLMGLEDVREINLSHGRLTGVALRALGQMPTLEVLHFQGANLTVADLGALENAPYRVLYLPNFFVQDDPALRVFSTMKNLRVLHLGNLVTAEMIAAMPILPKLEVFMTTTNDRVRDDLLPLLPQKFPALQRIDLWGGTGVQGETLVSLKGLKDLCDLGLTDTQVDDNKLAAIADMKRLQRLVIGGTKVTDACIPTLKTLKALDCLLIFQTQITDAGLLELAELRSLTTLGVHHGNGPPIGPPATGFTQAGLDAFQKKRPDVKVTR